MEVEQKSRNVSIVHVPYSGNFEQRFLLTADRHWDNVLSNQVLQKKHLDLAKRYKAGIIDIGDLFCAMQGKYDKRSRKSELRNEHKSEDYLDRLVSTAADFFEPYAKNIVMLGMGNHETNILKKHETNLTTLLTKELNKRANTKIYNGGYSGWITFQFENQKNFTKQKINLWYIHGYGGGGPVTRGVMQSNRKAVYLPDADIVISGHTHDEWIVPISRTRLDEYSRQYQDDQVHVQIPTYKDDYNDGYLGWHVETGKPPKPVGAIWLRFFREESRGSIQFDFYRAR